MRKVVLAAISNILMIILPLAGKPALILNFKIIIIVVGSISIWLTQPAVTVEETTEKKSSDRFSVLLILIMSLISVVSPIVDWAYFKDEQSAVSIYTFIGVFMIVAGIIFRAWAVRTLGKFFTPTVQISSDHKLITSGPYNIVRHPSYLGAFLSITAGAVLLESLVGFLIACAAMIIAYYVRITIEERELSLHFGDLYKQYKIKTKRIVPFIW